MSAELKPLRDLVPRLRMGGDFVMIAMPAQPEALFVWFKRCPCCGKAQPDPNKIRGGVALMTLDVPGAGLAIQYGLAARCGRRMNGQSSSASDRANKVSLSVLGAFVVLEELAQRETPPALVVGSSSTIAPGSKVAS